MPIASSGLSPPLSLQYSDEPACKTQPPSHYFDHVSEQGLDECWLVDFQTFVIFNPEFIDHARDLGLDGRAALPLSDQSHLADSRVLPQAAHSHRASVAHVHDDGDSAFQDE